MDGELDIVEGDALELLRIVFQNMGPRRHRRRLDQGDRRRAQRLPPPAAGQHRQPREAQRPAPLRPVGRTLPALPRRRHAVFLRLFRAPRHDAGGGADCQEAPHRREAADEARPAVLDIGSGWGGLGLYLAKTFKAEVLGVTLSTEQHAVATERAQARASRQPRAFRDQGLPRPSERFDRIVSVGMFEHVGDQSLPHFLRQMRDAAEARRRHAAAFDRPQRPAGRDQRLHPQIHLPGRLYSRAFGSHAGDRKVRPGGHRRRDPAGSTTPRR